MQFSRNATYNHQHDAHLSSMQEWQNSIQKPTQLPNSNVIHVHAHKSDVHRFKCLFNKISLNKLRFISPKEKREIAKRNEIQENYIEVTQLLHANIIVALNMV